MGNEERTLAIWILGSSPMMTLRLSGAPLISFQTTKKVNKTVTQRAAVGWVITDITPEVRRHFLLMGSPMCLVGWVFQVEMEESDALIHSSNIENILYVACPSILINLIFH